LRDHNHFGNTGAISFKASGHRCSSTAFVPLNWLRLSCDYLHDVVQFVYMRTLWASKECCWKYFVKYISPHSFLFKQDLILIRCLVNEKWFTIASSSFLFLDQVYDDLILLLSLLLTYLLTYLLIITCSILSRSEILILNSENLVDLNSAGT